MQNSASRPDIDCKTSTTYGLFWSGMQHKCGKDLPTSVAYAALYPGDDPERTERPGTLQVFEKAHSAGLALVTVQTALPQLFVLSSCSSA